MTLQYMTYFGLLVVDLFTAPMERFGFLPADTDIEDWRFRTDFVNAERYVRVSASVHVLDVPHEFRVILGEGGRNFMESDWNAIALWRLRNTIEGNDAGRNYALEPRRAVPARLEQALADLVLYGEDFLSGDLALFRELRSAQNRTRQPYQVYIPDEAGRYSATDEPESAAMKKKYS